jgi:hypothetical protein
MKPPIFVLRVQNQKALGPYVGLNGNRNWIDRRNFSLRQPEPEQDIIPNLPSDWTSQGLLSGFKDWEQLLNWFTARELRSLYELSFKVYQVPAEQIYFGAKQVLFKLAHPHHKTFELSQVLAFRLDIFA